MKHKAIETITNTVILILLTSPIWIQAFVD